MFAPSAIAIKHVFDKTIDDWCQNENPYENLPRNFKIRIVLDGVPALGKTTTAERIAKDSNRWTFIPEAKDEDYKKGLELHRAGDHLNGQKEITKSLIARFENQRVSNHRFLITERTPVSTFPFNKAYEIDDALQPFSVDLKTGVDGLIIRLPDPEDLPRTKDIIAERLVERDGLSPSAADKEAGVYCKLNFKDIYLQQKTPTMILWITSLDNKKEEDAQDFNDLLTLLVMAKAHKWPIMNFLGKRVKGKFMITCWR